MGEDILSRVCGVFFLEGGSLGKKAVIPISVIIWTGKITGEGNSRLMGLTILVLKLAADAKEKLLSTVGLYSNAFICLSSQDAAVWS